MPVMFCDAGHKCRSVVGATLSGMACGHCNQTITVSRAAVTCVSCTFCLCYRCCEQPNYFSTAKLRAKHPGPRGCGDDCRRCHENNGPCLVCGLGISIWHMFVRAKCAARHVSLQVGPHTTATLAEGEGVALGFRLPLTRTCSRTFLPCNHLCTGLERNDSSAGWSAYFYLQTLQVKFCEKNSTCV